MPLGPAIGATVARAKRPVTASRFDFAPLVGVGVILVLLSAAGPYLHTTYGGYSLWFVVIATALGAYFAATCCDHLDTRRALIVIAVGAVAMRLPQLVMEPYLSSDIYRYIWDGRVQAAGINPYRYIPNAAELAPLRDLTIYPLINRADYAPTIYPPAAQIYFFAITRLGETVLVMKLGLLAFEALAIAATMMILQRLGQPPIRVASFAWHPLAIWEIAGSGHVEAVMVGLMTVGLVLALTQRQLMAGVVIATAALVKPTALLVLPAIWRPIDFRLPAIVALTIVALYTPYLGVGSQVFGFLSGYVQEEGLSHGTGFRLVLLAESILGPITNGALIFAAFAAVVLASTALFVGFRTDRSPAAMVAWSTVLLTIFLVLLTPHYPWYYLALLPGLTVYPTSLTLWLLSIGGMQTYQIDIDALPHYDVRQITFHTLVLAAIAVDLGRVWLAKAPSKPQPETLHQ